MSRRLTKAHATWLCLLAMVLATLGQPLVHPLFHRHGQVDCTRTDCEDSPSRGMHSTPPSVEPACPICATRGLLKATPSRSVRVEFISLSCIVHQPPTVASRPVVHLDIDARAPPSVG